MADDNSAQVKSINTTRIQTIPIKINMLQGEQTGQPIYSNLTNAQSSQGAILVDFGFIDSKKMMAINHAVQTGDKSVVNFNAKMACRMVLSIEAANQFATQLNQLLNRNVKKASSDNPAAVTAKQAEQENVPSPESKMAETAKAEESGKAGFRFPWSKKK